MTHRNLITAALAKGRSILEKPLVCDDTLATADALRMLGVSVSEGGDKWIVEGGELHASSSPIDCNQSGTTLRLMLGVCSLLEKESIVTGAPQLLRRPNKPLLEGLAQLGVKTRSDDGYPPVTLKGPMRGGEARIRGDVSSQFISSIILAAPYAKEPVTVNVTTRLESKPYVQMTIDAMKRGGVRATSNSELTEIHVPQGTYKPVDTRIEGGWSSASFLFAAGVLSGNVHVDNVDAESSQADKEILHALNQMGANIKIKGKRVTAEKSHLTGLEMNLSDCPDIFPIISSLCAVAHGSSKLTGLGRLKIKESDRLEAMAEGLRAMGANIKVIDDTCTIEGGSLKGATIDPHGDHRIAMSFAVLGLVAEGETTINDPDCVNKSYPDFWEDLAALGADMRWIK
jgi:3-phosphoshikimate 1-carboxyvinyltransferase